MFIRKIESEGLAHFSYMVGEGNECAVIDPRRDCGIYLEEARERGARITLILETHRNEDYLAGSRPLAEMTGAQIWHADGQYDYSYGKKAAGGQKWKIGNLGITAIHAPGHTPGMFCYLLSESGGEPVVVFTGDALFAGDVGRVDLLGAARMEEMAGLLHETIFEKILPLGDGVIVCPAHGSGSVCGSGISSRAWTTIGLEKKLNPTLQAGSRKEFIRRTASELDRPPYFRKMEELNLAGSTGSEPFIPPPPLSPDQFPGSSEEGYILDVREMPGFGAAHLPGSQYIWKDGIPSFAGWLVPYDRPIYIVAAGGDDAAESARYLYRIGYDRIAGYLSGGIVSWHTSGKDSGSIDTLTVRELCGALDRKEEVRILDVRSAAELDSAGRIPGAMHIHITRLPDEAGRLPAGERIYIFCGSGLRSMVAASMLKIKGTEDLAVVIGGLSAWNSSRCPLDMEGKKE